MKSLPIILASASPWRKRLLEKKAVHCRIFVSNFKELKVHRSPRFLVLYNAGGKAREAANKFPASLVIGVDTIGVVKKKILGKPKSRAHAARMLRQLAGSTHSVFSGVHIINTKTGQSVAAVVETKLRFRKILPQELARYLDSNQWKGKAGAYAIQARAKGFVEKIEGDLDNVVGIPVKIVKRMIKIISNI